MLDSIKNVFRIPELRNKILFTLAIVFIYRLGGHIPTPGIEPAGLAEFFAQSKNNLFGMFDMFVGGSFTKATIFALGIMPYISASIIIQLMGTLFPYFHKLQKDGAEGRRKLTQLTRYGTVLLAIVQGFGIALFLNSIRVPSTGASVVMESLVGLPFTLLTVLSLTTGTVFVMWLGEQMTNKGIGNGMSVLILVGIVADIPSAVAGEIQQIAAGTRHMFVEIIILALILALTVAIIAMYQAVRRIPIQTPKKMINGKMYSGQDTSLPLKLNMAGVIPIIFASSVLMVPSMILGSVDNELLQTLNRYFTPGHIFYTLLFALIIIFFTYFYTSVMLNPDEIAENLKRSGGFIPGVSPGKKTAEYINAVLSRITLPSAVFLAFISIAPFLLISGMKVSFFFGGTSVLIVVGVALDTVQQIESNLQMRNYDGFLKNGSLRGRRS